ncbi:MAG: hypothetical protein QOE61_4818, partial [Micromonosporaceae bacterium]|nr:hypothetical protein [Micromonosporaceae bacterium]
MKRTQLGEQRRIGADRLDGYALELQCDQALQRVLLHAGWQVLAGEDARSFDDVADGLSVRVQLA